MTFAGLCASFLMRINLSIAITKMVIAPNIDNNRTSIDTTCPAPEPLQSRNVSFIKSASEESAAELFDWSQELQGIILSAYFCGYCISHLPAPLLINMYGSKIVLLIGILVNAVLSLATPAAVSLGEWSVISSWRTQYTWASSDRWRQCINSDAVHDGLLPRGSVSIDLLNAGRLDFGIRARDDWRVRAHWVLREFTDRDFGIHQSLIGSSFEQVGTISGNYFSGLLLHYFEGWHSVFYIYGVIAIVWCVIFHVVCTDTPDSHPFISDAEKDYLLKEVGQVGGTKNAKVTPWREILTSGPVIALTVACVSTSSPSWDFEIQQPINC